MMMYHHIKLGYKRLSGTHTHREGDSSILSPNFVMVATISNLPLFSCATNLALIIENILIRDKQTDKFHLNITIFLPTKCHCALQNLFSNIKKSTSAYNNVYEK